MKQRRIFKRKLIYSGRIFDLSNYSFRLGDSLFSEEVIEHLGAVALLPLKGGGEILMVKQFRPAVGKELLELPAGTIEKGEGERECAARELAEETGHSSGYIRKVLEFYLAPGYSSEKLRLFIARRLKPLQVAKKDPGEAIRIKTVRLEKALDMIEKGQISDAKTIIGLLYFAMRIAHRKGRVVK